MSGTSQMKKGILLTLGQLGTLCVSFAVPMFLSRHLSMEAYGTYKQLILIQWFLLMTLHFGMDFGLFYFIKKDPRNAPRFSLNAIAFEVLIAGLVGLVLWLGRDFLGLAFHNPEIVDLFIAFGFLILFTIPGQHFEHYLMVLDRIRFSAAVNLSYELLKAGSIIGVFLLGGSMAAVFYALAAVGALKLLTLIAFNLAHLPKSEASSTYRLFKEQWKYAVPLGGANLLSVLLRLDRLVIATLFTPRQFAIYAVGCLDIPLVPYYANVMQDLMSFEMVDSLRNQQTERLKTLWLSTKRRTSLFLFPIACYLLVFAPTVIPFIYGTQYEESIVIFQLFVVVFLVTILDCDILFRVFAMNRQLFRLQLVSGVFTIVLVVGGAYELGPKGALLGKLAADGITWSMKLALVKRPLGLTWSRLFQWREMLLLTGLGIFVAAILQQLIHFSSRLLTLAVSFPLYALATLLLYRLLSVFSPEEWNEITRTLAGKKYGLLSQD